MPTIAMKRERYRYSGRIRLARFVPWVLFTLVFALADGWLLHELYADGWYLPISRRWRWRCRCLPCLLRRSARANADRGRSPFCESPVSPDGRYVIFQGYNQQLLNPEAPADLYVYDTQTGGSKRVETTLKSQAVLAWSSASHAMLGDALDDDSMTVSPSSIKVDLDCATAPWFRRRLPRRRAYCQTRPTGLKSSPTRRP